MSRGPWALAAVVLAVGLLGAGQAPAAPPDEPILPIESYTSAEARALAEAHGAELRALTGDVRRCLPALSIDRHGIAFRRPRGTPMGPPALTLWVWLDGGEPPRGPDLATRAARAFRQYGQPLFRRLIARRPVFADPRVAGYGLILTWLGPASTGKRLVGESLAVFADKITVANFAHDTIGATAFLARAEVRAFEGQTELGSPRLSVDDDSVVDSPGC